MRSSTWAAAAATLAALAAAGPASAATLAVDDDRADCPAAAFTTIQAAVDAAAPGDTVTVCPGAYAEGSGLPGTNAVTIDKSLTLRGAGADLVTISPDLERPASGSILEPGTTELRNGVGDVLAIVGTPTQPLEVDVSGVTVDGYDPAGRPVAVEAGVVFLDAFGSLTRSRVTNVVTSEGENAFTRPGGYRGSQPGVGVAQVSAALQAPAGGTRVLTLDRTRVDKYNEVGVLISGAQGDDAPFVATGTINAADIRSSQVVGRTQCINFLGTGDCSRIAPLTTGPLFGQDGVRATSNARVKVTGSLLSQNNVNGTGAPVRSSFDNIAPQGQPANFVETLRTENNQNLVLGSGIRLAGASLTSFSQFGGLVINSQVSRTNIVDNAYGALNLLSDGTSSQTGSPNSTGNIGQVLKAEDNWWGINPYRQTNPGPQISPTTNPPTPENPVGGAPTGSTGPTGPTGPTSNSVDFQPYRSGTQVDPTAGEYAVPDAPIPVSDAPPALTALTSDPATAAPGATVTLTATATDDFGVKRVRFANGASTLGTAATPPYRQAVALPADAACGSTVTYSAIATDSLGQTAARSVPVTVACPAPPGPTGPAGPGSGSGPGTGTPPATPAPRLSVSAFPEELATPTTITTTPNAPAGIRSVAVLLGSRTACTMTAAPYTCRVTPTGADVGRQALRVVLTDLTGATAEVGSSVLVRAFQPRVSLSVTKANVRGGLARRTITGRLVRPSAVTAAQGCRSGRVTVVVKRAGRTVSNQQLPLTRSCTFTKRVTGPRSKQPYTVSARFGGNAVLRVASTSRRFS